MTFGLGTFKGTFKGTQMFCEYYIFPVMLSGRSNIWQLYKKSRCLAGFFIYKLQIYFYR